MWRREPYSGLPQCYKYVICSGAFQLGRRLLWPLVQSLAYGRIICGINARLLVPDNRGASLFVLDSNGFYQFLL